MKDLPLINKDAYLIYTRKSTDDSDNQKNSLGYQKTEALRFCKANNLKVASIDVDGFCTGGVISESHTGFKEDDDFSISESGLVQYRIERPKFHKLVSHLYKSHFKGVVFLCWDRASRNKNDDNILDKLIKKGVDVRFVQVTYDKSSAGELHKDIDSMFSQHYSRTIKEKVTNAIKALKEEGVCTFFAPVGYLNQGDSRNKPFDPKRAPIIKLLFEKYDEGFGSIYDLTRLANQLGLTNYPRKRRRTVEEKLSEEELQIEKQARPITANQLHRILTNPFYMGKIRGTDGQLIESASHEPLITEPLFNRVQKKLKSKNVSTYYTDKLNYPYRGMVRCAECKRAYTPYQKKGINYYAIRCAPGCSNQLRNINITFLEEKFGEKLKNLGYSKREEREIKEKLMNPVGYNEAKNKKMEVIKRRQKKIKEDLDYLEENKLMLLKTGVYEPKTLLDAADKFKTELEALDQEEYNLTVGNVEKGKNLITISELGKALEKFYHLINPAEKQLIVRTAISELFLSGNSLICKAKKGFEALEIPITSFGAPEAWLLELSKYDHLIKQSIQEAQDLISEIEIKDEHSKNRGSDP